MSDIKVKVSTLRGQFIGYFINPKVEKLSDVDYEVVGRFVDETGRSYDKVEFNPEALPYLIDLSEMSSLPFAQLESAYVQRGRQPTVMVAVRR